MANNIKGGAPNAVVAKSTVSFATAGITALNTEIIYLVDDPLKSYVPGRAINGISGFEADKGYYFVAKIDMDLESILVPPIATAPPEGFLANFIGSNGTALSTYIPESGTITNIVGSPTLNGSGGVNIPAGASFKTTDFDQSAFHILLNWQTIADNAELYVIMETAGTQNAYFQVDVTGTTGSPRVLKNDADVPGSPFASQSLSTFVGIEMQRTGNNIVFRKKNSDTTTTDLATVDVTGYTFTALKIISVVSSTVLESLTIN